jgi:hypothetical protein
VEADGHKLMSLHNDGGYLVPVTNLSQNRGSSILIRLAGLSFTSIKHLQIYHFNIVEEEQTNLLEAWSSK